MRNTIWSAALLLALGLGWPLAARAATGTFEGDLTMRISTDRTNGPQNVTVHVKGDQVRYDLPPSVDQQHEPMQAIVDMGKKRVLLVMPAQKTYALLDLNAIPPESKQAATQRIESAAADWIASPNGTQQTIAGRTCDPWQATDTKTHVKIDACLAPSLRIDFDRLLPSSMLPPAWTDKLRNGRLPMSATVHSADGKQTFDAQVTNVTPKPIPASTFAVPAGYRQITLPLTAFGDMLPRQ